MTRQLLTRPQLLATLADLVCAISSTHPLWVGVDGIDASGKTTLADELAHHIQQRHRPPLRASVDDFHHPRSTRYRRGALSPEGYYYDAFDYTALIHALLMPLGPTGKRWYRTQTFDYRADCPISTRLQHAARNAILIVDGVFLLRPELRPYWDMTIFLDIPFEMALARALDRDLVLFGTEAVIRTRYGARYIPGQQLYLELARPRDHADLVIDNTDPAHPLLYGRADQRSNEYN